MLGLVFACHLFTQLASEEYTYREELDIPFRARMGDYYYSGKVNRDGIFIPDAHTPPISADGYKYSSVGGLRHLSSYPPGHLKVYELRYGMLIPMTIRNGNFTPDEGGKIIRFEDYRYTVFARPIYNLPGTWVKKGSVFTIDPDEPLPKDISQKSK